MKNLTSAQEAALKLNQELTDHCVDDLTPVDMVAFENGISTILSASSLCFTAGRIVILIQLIALVSSGIYYYVCLNFPYEEDKEHCEMERKRNQSLLADEEAKKEIEMTNAVNN